MTKLTPSRKRKLAAAIAAFVLLVLAALLLSRSGDPQPAEAPEPHPERVKEEDGTTAHPVRSRKNVPDYAWWAGKPLKKHRAFVLAGSANTRENTVVAYVDRHQARRARHGLLITDALLTIQTVRPGSPRFELLEEEGLPAGLVQKLPGIGRAYIEDGALFAVVKPRKGDEAILVTAITPRLLTYALVKLGRGGKTGSASSGKTH